MTEPIAEPARPTKQDVIDALERFHANSPTSPWMDAEMIESINVMISIAFEGLWPEGDERYVTERAAAGFAMGFAVGRDYEQAVAFNLRFGLDPEG